MKNLARNLRQLSTDAEHRLWQQLRNRQACGAKFRRQHPVPPYIVDFVCLEKKLVIEADGEQHIEQQTYDEKRTAFLEARGFQVLRFWNNEILTQTEDVLDVIFRALNETPHPDPLPKRERG
ncbi:MAG: endonuclease domain-containing protein [Gammaproteobacteria bacterium]|nr:endonuclease domain-containing protein [Gammaproteobacteria bacterium]